MVVSPATVGLNMAEKNQVIPSSFTQLKIAQAFDFIRALFEILHIKTTYNLIHVR